MHPIYEKYLLLALGSGGVVALLSLLSHYLVGVLGVVVFLLLMAWQEKRDYDRLAQLSQWIQAQDMDLDQVMQTTGLREDQVKFLQNPPVRPIFRSPDITRALKKIKQAD